MARHDPEHDERSDHPVSKSQRKRDMTALQDMGCELVKLSADQLARFAMPDDLRGALLDWQRFTKHEAKRRQMQYIGKLMRGLDVEEIAERLAGIKGESDAAKARFHALETWRSRLLEDEGALTAWQARHPRSDIQHLRQLIRNARREAESGKPPKSSRELFRLLREISEADGADATAAGEGG